MATQGVKRKRTKNTSPEQLVLYIQFMENDYIFRSNNINPTLDPNYLIKKWDELVAQLNALGNGPSLSVEEWKKRFLDWKYGTKSIYRKIKALSIGTGGEPQSKITLNDLEERGVSVWGKVAVAGGSNVTIYEGIENPECQLNTICERDIICEPSISDQVNRSYEIIYTEPSKENNNEHTQGNNKNRRKFNQKYRESHGNK